MTVNEQTLNAIAANDNRRMERWIDPKFQKRYSLLLVSVVLLVGTVLIGTFWFHSEQVLNTLMSAGVTRDHKLFLIVQKQMSHLLWSVVGVVILFSAFIFAMAGFLSHRIVGPVFAVKRSLEAMGRRDFESARIKLRADDEFQEVAELVNQTVDQLQKIHS